MNSNHGDYNFNEICSLPPGRLQADSQISSTDRLFKCCHLPDSSIGIPRRLSSSSFEPEISSSYLSPVPSHTDAYLSSSTAKQYQFHDSDHSPEALASDWAEGQFQIEGAPLAKGLSVCGYRETIQTTVNTKESMSAVAVSFDPAFSMSNRPSLTWSSEPGSNQGLLPSYYGTPSDTAELSPPDTSRSITSSPPRLAQISLNEQREQRRSLTRQHHQQRRQMRTQQRVHRAGGSPYTNNSTVPDVTTQSQLPAYTTASAASSSVSMLGSTPVAIASQYSYPDTHQPGIYPYSTAQVPSSSYIPQVSQNYYSTYPQQTPATTQYATTSSPVSYAALPQVLSPPVPERVVQPRQKPQCWDHGCNGRQFSTFSNLLRHQREKSGQAAKSVCPRCGAEFTRTTARNGHMNHDKCKRRNNSTEGISTT